MSFVDSLYKFKCGLLNATSFQQKEITKRVKNLRLSLYCDVESVHTSGINSLDLENVEGRYLLSGAADGSIYVHDVFNFTGSSQFTCKNICKIDKKNRYCHKYSVECVQWYPLDTGMFLSSGMDHCLNIWDANRLVPADTFMMSGKIYHHHMSPVATQHNLVAVATQRNEVILADLRTGSKAHELRGHSGSVLTAKWSPLREFYLASGSMDNHLLMWDVRSSRSCLFSMDQNNGQNYSSIDQTSAHNGYVHGLSFTSCGLFLLSVGTDKRMRLWNTETGRNEMVNYGKISLGSKKAIRFDVSNDTNPPMVFVPSQGNILVYELNTGIKTNTLLGHYNTVTCCIYSNFSQTLYSGANDRNILVWASENGDIRESTTSSKLESRSLIPRNITEDAWSSDEG